MARKPKDDKAAIRRFSRMAVLIDEPVVEEVEESKRNSKLGAPRGGGGLAYRLSTEHIDPMFRRGLDDGPHGLSAEELVGKRLGVEAQVRCGFTAPPGLGAEELA